MCRGIGRRGSVGYQLNVCCRVAFKHDPCPHLCLPTAPPAHLLSPPPGEVDAILQVLAYLANVTGFSGSCAPSLAAAGAVDMAVAHTKSVTNQVGQARHLPSYCVNAEACNAAPPPPHRPSFCHLIRSAPQRGGTNAGVAHPHCACTLLTPPSQVAQLGSSLQGLKRDSKESNDKMEKCLEEMGKTMKESLQQVGGAGRPQGRHAACRTAGSAVWLVICCSGDRQQRRHQQEAAAR